MSSHSLILAVLLSAVAVVAVSSSVASTVSRAWEEGEAATNGLLTTKVVISNDLKSQQNLQVHCKDKNSDFGEQQVPYKTEYSFSIDPNPFSSDYFCGFVFDNVLHQFDIYLGKRDFGQCTGKICYWSVIEDGPCFVDSQNPNRCYSWN